MLLRMGRLMEEYLFISSFERANKKKKREKKREGREKETKKRNETKNVRFVNHSMNTKMET